jgi:hypothetical protein
MNLTLDHTTLHRAAKYFMDSGKAASHEAAMNLLQQFGLTIYVGEEIRSSAAHQIALLTIVNVTRRTLLGGVEVIGLPDCDSLTALAPNTGLKEAVMALGGTPVAVARPEWPTALIGSVEDYSNKDTAWRVTWEGWRAGAAPLMIGDRLSEDNSMALAPALAAAVCAGEVFSHYAGDHPMAGRRTAGLSLWQPGADWLDVDESEPELAFLPSNLWIIGLGNLGQAFAWLLALMPYETPQELQLVLQDYDRIAPSNDSTSLLSYKHDTNKMKARVVADWLDKRGFTTFIEERRFGPWTKRHADEPGVALCGVDNALARSALDQAGFPLIVEAGLGGGPQAFRSLGIHTFPSSRTAAEIWAKQVALADTSTEDMPAYQALKKSGIDACGLTHLASRTVGVPFVGLIAACLAMSELLRRLHGGKAFEFIAGSTATLQDIEFGTLHAPPYAHGYTRAMPMGWPTAP